MLWSVQLILLFVKSCFYAVLSTNFEEKTLPVQRSNSEFLVQNHFYNALAFLAIEAWQVVTKKYNSYIIEKIVK